MRLLRLSVLVILCAFGVGCANLNSVYRDFNVSQGSGAFIDIKQRGVYVIKKVTPQGEVIICAEPSPDALSAYAAELAAKVQLPNGIGGELSGAFKENAQFTGLRTQSIQLLRDSQFRICEAYMNGAITELQYDLLARRYQKQTVALLAIEQLTGAVRAPSVIVNTDGLAEAAKDISDMQKEIAAKDKDISDLQAKNAVSGISDADKAKFDADIKTLQSDKAAIVKKMEKAKQDLSSGSASPASSSIGVPAQKSDQNMQAVAKTVWKIVKSITKTDDFLQLCFYYAQKDYAKLSENGKRLQTTCVEAFEFDQKLGQLKLKAMESALSIVIGSSMTDAQKLEEMQKLFNQQDSSTTVTGQKPSPASVDTVTKGKAVQHSVDTVDKRNSGQRRPVRSSGWSLPTLKMEK